MRIVTAALPFLLASPAFAVNPDEIASTTYQGGGID